MGKPHTVYPNYGTYTKRLESTFELLMLFTGEMGFDALGLGLIGQKQWKMEMRLRFEQDRY